MHPLFLSHATVGPVKRTVLPAPSIPAAPAFQTGPVLRFQCLGHPEPPILDSPPAAIIRQYMIHVFFFHARLLFIGVKSNQTQPFIPILSKNCPGIHSPPGLPGHPGGWKKGSISPALPLPVLPEQEMQQPDEPQGLIRLQSEDHSF